MNVDRTISAVILVFIIMGVIFTLALFQFNESNDSPIIIVCLFTALFFIIRNVIWKRKSSKKLLLTNKSIIYIDKENLTKISFPNIEYISFSGINLIIGYKKNKKKYELKPKITLSVFNVI